MNALSSKVAAAVTVSVLTPAPPTMVVVAICFAVEIWNRSLSDPPLSRRVLPEKVAPLTKVLAPLPPITVAIPAFPAAESSVTAFDPLRESAWNSVVLANWESWISADELMPSVLAPLLPVRVTAGRRVEEERTMLFAVLLASTTTLEMPDEIAFCPRVTAELPPKARTSTEPVEPKASLIAGAPRMLSVSTPSPPSMRLEDNWERVESVKESPKVPPRRVMGAVLAAN